MQKGMDLISKPFLKGEQGQRHRVLPRRRKAGILPFRAPLGLMHKGKAW